MSKKTPVSGSLLSHLSVKYGDKLTGGNPATKEFLNQKIAEQKLTDDKRAEFVESKKEKSLTAVQEEYLKEEQEAKAKLPPAHSFDDEPDPMSPPTREGRRIATRLRRDKAIQIKLTPEEHDALRRVAGHFCYSLAQMLRILVKERDAQLWPDKSMRPNLLELDMADNKKKDEAREKTEKWIQRKRNAQQAKEAKYRQELKRVEDHQKRIDERKKKALIKLNEMEVRRAALVEGTKKMNQQLADEAFVKRQIEKEAIVDVEYALNREESRLGRSLTQTEKWTVGNRVRAMKGGTLDTALEIAISKAISEKQASQERALTLREQWNIRRETRAKSRE